jgi:Protein of unknown function (DUF3630)
MGAALARRPISYERIGRRGSRLLTARRVQEGLILGYERDLVVALDALELREMASRHLCVNLSATVDWEKFPDYATALLETLRGSKIRALDAVDSRIWVVEVAHETLQLVFDDFPIMVSIESSDDGGDRVLREIYKQLLRLKTDV